jgi:hypothetical protein
MDQFVRTAAWWSSVVIPVSARPVGFGARNVSFEAALVLGRDPLGAVGSVVGILEVAFRG